MNQTIVYTYDNGGNIKSKKIYAYTTATDPGTPTQTISYTYDSTWKDKLVSYGNDSITYDAIGNPLTYRDGMTFTWNGRQMATANLNGTAVTYKYDADGLRNYKKVGTTVHEYEYVGGQLVYEKRGDLKFYYRYNAMGELASIKRIDTAANTETSVYVVSNTRGDIEELRLADGSLYARYVYDSWGNVLHVYNSSGVEETNVNALSLQNPFRYRSYYYDAESGLYYLQSRYYDPVTDRFVSADSIVNTTDVLGFNMYAYCGNNPVARKDDGGNLWDIVFDIVSIAYSVCEVIKNPKSVTNWLALAADVASAVVPGISGGGAAVKAVAKHGDDVLDLAKAGDKVYDASKVVDNTKSASTTIYRSVSADEAADIISTGRFNLPVGGMESKQFAFDLNETRNFGNWAGQNTIVSAQLPTKSLKQFYSGGVGGVDRKIFPSGTITVYGEQLDGFNKLVDGTIKFIK